MKPEEESAQEPQSSGMGLHDILFILFRHKGKVLFCFSLGLAAALAVYFLLPRLYESKAKMLVRYVLDNSAVDRIDAQVKAPRSIGENLINSEVQILASQDLAKEVADAIGPERFVSKKNHKSEEDTAAQAIVKGLKAVAVPESNIIDVSYQNTDPVLATRVLEELVDRYFVKHLEVHRSVGAFDFVSRQAESLKAQLSETEAELKKLKAEAGISEISSLADSTAMLNAKLKKAEEDLVTARADYAAQRARVTELERLMTGVSSEASGTKDLPNPSLLMQYQSIVTRLNTLRQNEYDQLTKFTPESRVVQLTQSQIRALDSQRREMEQKSPGLMGAVPQPGGGPQKNQLDLVAEKARLVALQTKVDSLAAEVRDIEGTGGTQSDIRAQIAQLERKRESDEANYKYYQASVDKARVDEALDPSKIPNISLVERPTAAAPATGRLYKLLIGLVLGGLILGAGSAFLIETVIDRSVKRPLELETRLRIPLVCSIPLISNGADGLVHGDADGDGKLVPWDKRHFVRPFSMAIRDRLLLDFELNHKLHKPKLLAVGGLSEGAGASTLAAGLAAAFSETGDGKVLLVDMNVGQGEAHPFSEGRPACALTDLLRSNNKEPFAKADENLYLAKAVSSERDAKEFLARKLYDLVPRFKASEFDYVVFDMPPFNECTATLSIAGFMDKVLLVIEAEVNNREYIKRAHDDLVKARANVSAIFNKRQSHAPKWLEDQV